MAYLHAGINRRTESEPETAKGKDLFHGEANWKMLIQEKRKAGWMFPYTSYGGRML